MYYCWEYCFWPFNITFTNVCILVNLWSVLITASVVNFCETVSDCKICNFYSMIFLFKLLSVCWFCFSSLSVDGTPLGTYLRVKKDGVLPEIKFPERLSADCKQLILKMIRYEPRERCKISEVCQVLRKIRLDSGKLTGRQSSSSSSVNNLRVYVQCYAENRK